MGKRFVVRSRQDWEALLAPESESDDARLSASRWLASRLEGYVQSTPESPITLAVPDRFLDILGDAATHASSAIGEQQGAPHPERQVR